MTRFLTFLSFGCLLSLLLVGCSGGNKNQSESTLNLDLRDTTIQYIIGQQNQRNAKQIVRFATSTEPTHRLALAYAMASIQDTATIATLDTLLYDEYDQIKIAAAHAFGQTGSPKQENRLIKAFQAATDDHVRAALLEAIGKSASEKYLPMLASVKSYKPTDTIRLEGLAWGIFRYQARQITSAEGTARMFAWATTPSTPSTVRYIAAAYLARLDSLKLPVETLLTTFDNEKDTYTKMFLATALGKTNQPGIWKSIEKGVQQPDQDYRVKCRLLGAMKTIPYDSIRAALALKLINDNNPHVAATAAHYLLDNGNVNDAVQYRLAATNAKHRQVRQILEAAYLKNAKSRKAKFEFSDTLRIQYQNATNPTDKAAILQSLAEFPVNYRFIADQAFNTTLPPAVRTSAIEALVKIRRSDAFNWAFADDIGYARREFALLLKRAIESKDIALIGTAAEALADPKLGFKANFRNADFLLAGLQSLKLPRDVEAYTALAHTIQTFGDTLVAPYQNTNTQPVEWGAIYSMGSKAKAVISTPKGDITLLLLPEQAPATVANFIKLIKNGSLNKTTFHRVVPTFVVQGACPRGDGWGSMDYTIRSEFANTRFDNEGWVGMPSSGKDTESTQLFITTAPAPHLDGHYTLFAKVVSGMDVVHKIERGDAIEQITLR